MPPIGTPRMLHKTYSSATIRSPQMPYGFAQKHQYMVLPKSANNSFHRNLFREEWPLLQYRLKHVFLVSRPSGVGVGSCPIHICQIRELKGGTAYCPRRLEITSCALSIVLIYRRLQVSKSHRFKWFHCGLHCAAVTLLNWWRIFSRLSEVSNHASEHCVVCVVMGERCLRR